MSRWRSAPIAIDVGAHEGSVIAAVHALREALSQMPARACVKVRLADCWVRYRLLPWRDDLTLEAAWQAYAQQVFAHAAMPLNDGWTLALLPLRYGAPRLALAIKAELAAELATPGVATLTVTTKFLDVLQALPLQPQATVGVLDDGRLTLARLQAGAVQAVQSLRFDADDPDAKRVLARQRGMLGGEAPLCLYATEDKGQALRGDDVSTVDLSGIQALSSGPIQLQTSSAGNAPRTQAAVALLLPIVCMAAVLAVLRYQAAALTAQTEGLAQRASDRTAASLVSDAARAEALTLAQWLWPQWEEPLNAVHAAWPAGFRATRLQVDGAHSALRLEGSAPDLAQVSVLATKVPGATVTQMALEPARAGAAARFELSVPWEPPR